MRSLPLALVLMLSVVFSLEAQDRLELETLEFPDLIDSNRQDRRVPIKIHYPREKGLYPLVIFSRAAASAWGTT